MTDIIIRLFEFRPTVVGEERLNAVAYSTNIVEIGGTPMPVRASYELSWASETRAERFYFHSRLNRGVKSSGWAEKKLYSCGRVLAAVPSSNPACAPFVDLFLLCFSTPKPVSNVMTVWLLGSLVKHLIHNIAVTRSSMACANFPSFLLPKLCAHFVEVRFPF